MRRLAATLAAAVALVAAVGAAVAPARADTVGLGAAALGVGMFGDRPQTTFDLGIDVQIGMQHGQLAFGLGGRLRLVAGQGVYRPDWDEASELAGIVRHASYRRAADGAVPGLAVALGALADARLGHGSVVAGYTSELIVEHGRVGAQAVVESERVVVGVLLDDVVAPRIAGLRIGVGLGDAIEIAGLAAVDRNAPAMEGDALLGLAAIEAEVGWGELDRGALDADGWRAALRAELVAAGMRAAGAHLGGRFAVASSGTRVDAGLGLHAGSDGYVPGWMGPLYEVERGRLIDASRAGGLAGVGGAAELAIAVDGLGELAASGLTRPGLPDVGKLRLAAPYREGFQLAAWAAKSGELAGVALELRAELPAGLFASLEAARLYRDTEAGLAPMWTALVAFGSSLAFGGR